MYPLLLKIGPISFHTYGLFVALGFLAAFHVAKRQFSEQNLPSDFLEQGILWFILVGIVGARATYFLVEDRAGWMADPLAFFRIWEGGLVFYGGFVAGVIFLAVYARRRGVSFLTLMDGLVGPLLIGQAFGRVGCFFAGCCYGKPTDSFWGVVFKNADSLAPRFVKIHPTQLYSSAGDFLLFIGLWLMRDRMKKPGANLSYYCLGYGSGRFLVEFLRGDDRGAFVAGLSPGQWISLLLIVFGIVLAIQARRRHAQ